MVSKRIITSPVFIAFVPAVLVAIVIALVNLGIASQQAKNRSLVSPADLRARAAFQANWQAIAANAAAKDQAKKAVVQIPITGNISNLEQGMTRRAMEAYSSRLSGIADQQTGMSQRAMKAYSARLSGFSDQQTGMSQRALNAYAARLEAQARYYQSLRAPK